MATPVDTTTTTPMDTTTSDTTTLVEVKKITIETEEEKAYYKLLSNRFRLLKPTLTLIVTNLLTTLWSTICKVINNDVYGRTSRGILIEGPMGTGKTSSLLYLLDKLKSDKKIPALLIDASFDKAEFANYLRWFCERNGVIVEDNKNPINTVNHIIDSYRHPIRSFLLIEMGNTLGREAGSISCLLSLAIKAVDLGWYVVVASSSGSGWMLENKEIRELSHQLRTSIGVIVSHNFSEEEMKECMKELKIGETWFSKIFEVTAGNPFLVSRFEDVTNEGEFEYSNSVVELDLESLTSNLIRSMTKEHFSASLSVSNKWLTYAVQSIPIQSAEVSSYRKSYVAREYITYLCKDGDKLYIQLAFPTLYSAFMKRLKTCYDKKDDVVRQFPIVQGLVFEEKFLSHVGLTTMCINARNGDNAEMAFTFPVIPATFQMDKDLASLSPGVLHHLRPGHFAIDAVCLSDDVSSGNRFLLLIQVSLSSYANHDSKCSDIYRKVSPRWKVSIAEYYRQLSGVDDDHVIYVYASPQELKAPTKDTFLQATTRVTTRGRRHTPNPHWYGFVMEDSATAAILKQVEASLY